MNPTIRVVEYFFVPVRGIVILVGWSFLVIACQICGLIQTVPLLYRTTQDNLVRKHLVDLSRPEPAQLNRAHMQRDFRHDPIRQGRF